MSNDTKTTKAPETAKAPVKDKAPTAGVNTAVRLVEQGKTARVDGFKVRTA